MSTFPKYPQDPIITSLSILGFLLISAKILTFLKWVYKSFLRQPKPLLKYGPWAVITGPTDGIGKALAFQLASKSLNLILIGRNPVKLQQTSNEILKKYYDKNIEIKLIVIDFSSLSGPEIERVIREEIGGVEVGILINNVGLSSNGGKYFHEGEIEGVNELIRVNLESLSWVTKGVICGMMVRKKGLIVNIGSGSSVVVPSYPLFAVYAATKGYVAMFSRSLHVEYKRYGIDVQCQVPLLVATKLASIKKSSFFVPSPEQYSKASIRWMGYDFLCVPYWTHALQWFVFRSLPDSLVNWFLLKYFLNLRKKLIQKELRKKK